MNRGRLAWQCRRGMRELDEVLEHYLANRYAIADLCEQRAFAKLLELPDPALYACLMGDSIPEDPDARRVVEHLARTRA
ncbi:MAG TPA: succinate dehydrogenase assembly factor 2 [Steroidobacteraceae bacterium]|nr:succinate dehydrogenase assembly factor 2 [Steroidobacteraceae bacterium]